MTLHDLFDPARHEPLAAPDWTPDLAWRAIERIGAAAHAAFDPVRGHWPWHPQDDPPQPGAHSLNLYWGATGVFWALGHLAAVGAVPARHDWARWIEQGPAGLRAEAAEEQHGSASYLFGESAALLLAWQHSGEAALADRLHAVVQGNRHNPAEEPLWGNAGTVLAAIRMAELSEDPRWPALVNDCLQALDEAMRPDPDIGHWVWHQDLYGRPSRYLGGGHGLAGNAYAVLRAGALAEPALATRLLQRVLDTLTHTALAAQDDAGTDCLNWHVLVDPERVAAWLARGGRPLVQDCHGAPGIVCRLATAPRTPDWDRLLRGAGELTWRAGPLSKGPSLCHGTAGSAMACLKLWRRFGERTWLARARQLALHAAAQVEQARLRHGDGRHSLWTGDLGVACTLWNCLIEDDRFPTLDHF